MRNMLKILKETDVTLQGTAMCTTHKPHFETSHWLETTSCSVS